MAFHLEVATQMLLLFLYNRRFSVINVLFFVKKLSLL